jgi:predicted porin
MKKKIFVAAMLICVSDVASAQANVTLYGVVDAGLAYESGGGNSGSSVRLDSGMLNGSRFGFVGKEPLGNGLAAIFQLENGFAVDTGEFGQGGLLFGRQAWVGLSGNFGTVKLGRQPTVFFSNSDVFDPFGDTLAGDSARLFNYYGSRTNNTISYAYAAGRLRGELDYSLGELPGSSGNRTIAGFIGYRSELIDAIVAHHTTKDASGLDSAETTLIGGNYNFGLLKIFSAYAQNKGFSNVDTRDALLGLAVSINATDSIMSSYIRKIDKRRGNANADQIAIGYVHDLSKRTALYTSFSRTTNDELASYNVEVKGASNKLFNVGIRHKF